MARFTALRAWPHCCLLVALIAAMAIHVWLLFTSTSSVLDSLWQGYHKCSTFPDGEGRGLEELLFADRAGAGVTSRLGQPTSRTQVLGNQSSISVNSVNGPLNPGYSNSTTLACPLASFHGLRCVCVGPDRDHEVEK